jgi:hypothetical protein
MATLSVGGTTVFDGSTLQSGVTGIPAISLDNATTPAFLVQATAMSNLAIGTDVIIDYDTVIKNVGGGTFDTTQGTNSYTAPVSGLYQINVCAFYDDFPNNVTDVRLKIVTSNRTYQRRYAKFINAEHTSNYDCTFDFSQLVDLDASDTCVIKIYQNGGSAAGDLEAANSYFSGFLVSKY